MDIKTKILRFLASDKYFTVWKILLYCMSACVAIFFLNFERTEKSDAILQTLLAFLAPVFFLANALQRKIPAKYRELEEYYEEDYEEDSSEDSEKNTKEPNFIKRNHAKISKILLSYSIFSAVVYGISISADTMTNSALFSNIFLTLAVITLLAHIFIKQIYK